MLPVCTFGRFFHQPPTAHELGIIDAQYPATPLRWLPNNPRIPFEEGIKMLQDAGYEVPWVARVCSCTHVLG